MRSTTWIISLLLIASDLTAQTQVVQERDALEVAKQLAFSNRDYDKAIDIITTELVERPKDLEMNLFLSRVYFWSGKHQNALRSLDSISKIDANNFEAKVLRIDIYESSRQHIKASELIENTISDFPESNELFFRLAYNYFLSENYTKAKEAIVTFLQENKDHAKGQDLDKQISAKLRKNFVIGSYQYFFLDTPEQTLNFQSLQYARSFHGTTLIGMLNSGKSSDGKGLQYGIEMYNDLGQKYYSYVHFSHSSSILFPKTRVSLAIYRSMKYNMEASIYLSFLSIGESQIQVISPSLTKSINNTSLTASVNIINKGFSNELTYRIRMRQHIGSHLNYVGLALGSFSREETIRQMTESDLSARYITYESQIALSNRVLLGLNYNRNITKGLLARDQLTAFLKHNF